MEILQSPNLLAHKVGYTFMHHLDDVDDILLHGSKTLDYLVVGYKLDFHKFFDVLNNNWTDVSKDLTVMGHILDRRNNWYELHCQCFLINLKWWNDVGRPVFGKEGLHDDAVQLPNVIRSKDNHHSDYTPLWISKDKGHAQYHNTKFGYNILSHALQNNTKVYSFDDALRSNKLYFGYTNKATKQKFADRFRLGK